MSRMQEEARKLQAQQDAAAAQMRADLAALSAIMDAKEAEFRQKLITPNSANKELPIDKIVKLVSERSVDVSTAPSDKMKNMVESLFGGSFLKALKGLILGALDTVLGNAKAGEKTKEGFTVILLHGAVVRVDYYIYAYTFRSDGVKTNVQNGLVFATAMSTVKLRAVNSEVIALLSGLTAEGSIGFLKRYNAKVEEINRRAKAELYTKDEAASIIVAMFGDGTSPDPTNTLRDQVAVKLALTDGAIATTDLNAILAGKTGAEAAIPQSEFDQIFEEQKRILDRMIVLYEKIREMKISTDRDIQAANQAITQP